jgi:hypothetical protein
MERIRRPWIRAAMALALVGALTVGVLMSPVGAAVTKKKVKRTATKVVNSLAPGIADQVATQIVNGVSQAYSTFKDTEAARIDISGTGGVDSAANTIGTLAVPAGSYVLFAKLFLQNASPAGTDFVDCSLHAGGSRDISAVTLDSSQMVVALNFVQTLPNGGNVEVRCSDFQGGSTDIGYKFLRITAMKVATLTNTPLP